MADLSTVRVDPNAERDGVWLTFYDDIEVKLAHVSSPDFADAVARLDLDKRTRAMSDLRDLSDRASQEDIDALARVYAKHAIRDWRNLQLPDDDGTLRVVPYEWTTAFDLLRDPAYRPFFNFVYSETRRDANFRAAALENAAGN